MGPGSEVEGVGLAFRRTLAPVLLFTVVCLTALNLRSGIASVAPVLGQIQDFFGISSGQAGLLTALPGLCFAAMGLAAVPIARRVGLSRTLAGGTVALVAGSACVHGSVAFRFSSRLPCALLPASRWQMCCFLHGSSSMGRAARWWR